MQSNGANLLSVLALGVLSFAAGPAQATEQRKDEIKLDGGTHDLLSFPLGYPEDWSKPVEANLRGICSGAWQRYKAFWEVRDEVLWLVKVLDNPCGDDHREIPLNPIVADAGLMLTVEKGRITKREFQDRRLYVQ